MKMIHPDPNTEYFAKAQFKAPGYAEKDGNLAWAQHLIPPSKADSPGHVAAHLRFSAQRSALRQLTAAIHLGGAVFQCHGTQDQWRMIRPQIAGDEQKRSSRAMTSCRL